MPEQSNYNPSLETVLSSTVVEQAHPRLTAGDRVDLSMFAGNEAGEIKMLQRKGFAVAKDEDGRLVIWRDGDTQKYRTDAKWYHLSDLPGDVADASRGVVEISVGMAALALKLPGAAAAPVTGGTSLLATSAAGAALTTATNLGIQLTGIALHKTDELDYEQLAAAMVAGAVAPGIGKGVGFIGGKVIQSPLGQKVIEALTEKQTELIALLKESLTPIVEKLRTFSGNLSSPEGAAFLASLKNEASEALQKIEGTVNGWIDQTLHSLGVPQPVLATVNGARVTLPQIQVHLAQATESRSEGSAPSLLEKLAAHAAAHREAASKELSHEGAEVIHHHVTIGGLKKELADAMKKLHGDPLGSMIDSMRAAVQASDSPRTKALLGLLDDIEKASVNYIRTVTDFVACSLKRGEVVANSGPAAYRASIEILDKTRTSAHNVLIDSLKIFFRNASKDGIEGAPALAQQFVGDPRELTYRRSITDHALIYVHRKVNDLLGVSN